MRTFKDGRIYDTEKSDCITYVVNTYPSGEYVFRAIYRKRNNQELFYYYEERKSKRTLTVPIKEESLKSYMNYLELVKQ